jgi:hypothetical protein
VEALEAENRKLKEQILEMESAEKRRKLVSSSSVLDKPKGEVLGKRWTNQCIFFLRNNCSVIVVGT